jgi:hypothetical protein
VNDQAKEATLRFAEVVEEVARRLRLPNPDPKVIELAAQDLEQMGRDLRASALATEAASVADYISAEVAGGRLNPLDDRAVEAATAAFLEQARGGA